MTSNNISIVQEEQIEKNENLVLLKQQIDDNKITMPKPIVKKRPESLVLLKTRFSLKDSKKNNNLTESDSLNFSQSMNSSFAQSGEISPSSLRSNSVSPQLTFTSNSNTSTPPLTFSRSSSQTVSPQAKIPFFDANNIVSYVYVGSVQALINVISLLLSDIKYVLNVAHDVDESCFKYDIFVDENGKVINPNALNTEEELNKYFGNNMLYDTTRKIQVKMCGFRDGDVNGLTNNLKDCIQYIETCVENKCNILVNCQAGKSRSVSVVLAYMMKQYAKSIKLIKENDNNNDLFMDDYARKSTLLKKDEFTFSKCGNCELYHDAMILMNEKRKVAEPNGSFSDYLFNVYENELRKTILYDNMKDNEE